MCHLANGGSNLNWLTHSVVRVNVAQSLANVLRKCDCDTLHLCKILVPPIKMRFGYITFTWVIPPLEF